MTKTYAKGENQMGFMMIFAGLVFMFNPCINIVDILPDFIGCILIAAGLYRLSDIEDRFLSARVIVMRMIPIYVLKLVLSVYLPVRWKSGLLPVTFAYAVGEIITSILFFSALYGGIEYMANLHDGSRHLRDCASVSKTTILFMVLKNVLAFVPEAFALEKQAELDFSYHKKTVQTLTLAKPYVVAFFTVIVLAYGIYCLYINAKLFKGISKDTAFIGNLSGIYTERVTENKKLMNRRAFRRFFVLLILAAIFTVDVIIDAVNFTPDFVVFCLIYAAARCICRKSTSKKITVIFVISLVVSVLSTVMRYIIEAGINFRMGYSSYASFRVASVDNGTAAIAGGVVTLLEGILFIVMLYLVFKMALERVDEISQRSVPALAPVVFAAISGISSVAALIAPCLKAAYYNHYINDTLLNEASLAMSTFWELAGGYANIAVGISAALLVYSIIKVQKKVEYLV